MLKWILQFFGKGIIRAGVDAYKAKLAAGNSTEHIAAVLADRELQVQQREIEANVQLRQAEIGAWYEPDHLFGYIMVAFFAKVVVWDTMLGLGTTPSLKGQVGQWAGTVIAFYLGKRGVENVTRILSRVLRR